MKTYLFTIMVDIILMAWVRVAGKAACFNLDKRLIIIINGFFVYFI